VQVFDDRLPPVGLALQVIVPVGVVGVPLDVSLTVAVQVVSALSPTGLGEHTTLTLVARRVTLSAMVPELAR